MISEAFEEKEVALIEGDVDVAAALLELPFNHIFFTGCTRVGKLVMTAAAKHLATVTLELGGKSPVIVDESADVQKIAEDLAAAKQFNGGSVYQPGLRIYQGAAQRRLDRGISSPGQGESVYGRRSN
jgi:aldehyde dehydrogenase (NAD+)